MWLKENILPFSVFLMTASVLVVIRTSTHPSLDRNWEPNQKILASVDISGDDVSMRNIRNTQYHSATSYEPVYFDRSYRLSDLEKACLVSEDLGAGQAHLMVTFKFRGQGWVVFSPEPRLEKGETFSALAGFFRRYELATVVATESDAIYLRTNVLNHPVSLFELKLDDARMRELFLKMASRESALAHDPEFYHTLFNNVSEEIMDAFRTVARRSVIGPLLLPSHAARRAYDMRILRSDVSVEMLLAQGAITDDARAVAPDADFSEKIHKAVEEIQEGL